MKNIDRLGKELEESHSKFEYFSSEVEKDPKLDKIRKDLKDIGAYEESEEITYEEFQAALSIVKKYEKQIKSHYSKVQKEVYSVNKFAGVTGETGIFDTDLGVRTLNALRQLSDNFQDFKIKDLEGISIRRMSGLKNMGKVSINEIKEMCFYAGVKLKP